MRPPSGTRNRSLNVHAKRFGLKEVFDGAGSQRPASDDNGPLQNRDMHQVMVDLLRRLNP